MVHIISDGRTSLYVQHGDSGHMLEARYYELDRSSGKPTLRVVLHPRDAQQLQDAEYSLSHPVTHFGIDDQTVIDCLVAHLADPGIWAVGIRLELVLRDRIRACYVAIHRQAADRLRLIPKEARTGTGKSGWRRWIPFGAE